MYNNRIGVIYSLADLLEKGVKPLLDLGVECAQLTSGNIEIMTPENAEKAKRILDGKIIISSFWAAWSGPATWNNVEGPLTLGLVPESYRFIRLKELEKGADFAAMLGAPNIATHVGFIPESPSLPDYLGVAQAVKHIASYCKNLGLDFNFETGQETPTTLMRLITDIGLDNLGINLDPANLLLYGRGNPVDALDLFRGYIKGVHIKDGDYPQGDYHKLGKEKPVGEGMVNFPVFLPKLLAQGYTGDLYIEREISGEQQIKDIKMAIEFVRKCLQGH